MSCVVLVWLVAAGIRGLSQVLPRLPVSRLGWAGLGWAGLAGLAGLGWLGWCGNVVRSWLMMEETPPISPGR